MSQALSNLAIGSKVKFGSYSVNGETAQPIVWTIVAKNHTGYPDNSVTLHTSNIIDLRCFDAKEPNNSNSSRVAYGNNYYSVSNIDQWLNKDADGGSWYVAAHGADSAPDTAANTRVGTQYAARPGFLNAFTTNEKNAILSTTIRVVKPTADGGSYEDIVRKVFLPSITEMGLGNENDIAEGTAWGYYTTATARAAYATTQCYSNTQSSSKASSQTTNWQWWLRTSYATQTHYARLIMSSGGTSSGYAYSGQYGIRPALNLSNTLNVSDSADSDGCYTFEWSGSSGGGTSGGSSSVWVGGTETYTENETRSVEVSLDNFSSVDYIDEMCYYENDNNNSNSTVRINTVGSTVWGNKYIYSIKLDGIIFTTLTASSTASNTITFNKDFANVKCKLTWMQALGEGVTDHIKITLNDTVVCEKTGTDDIDANYVCDVGNVKANDMLTYTIVSRSGSLPSGQVVISSGYECHLSSDPITITETVPVQKTRGVNKPVSSIYAGVTATVPVYTETTTTEDIALSLATFTDFFSGDNTGTTGTNATGLKWAAQSGGGLKLTFGNYGINSSTSMTTFTAQRDLTNVAISSLYYTESNWDKITLIVAGTTVLDAVSGTSSSLTQRWNGSLAKGQTIVLKYVKDGSNHATNESSTYFKLTCDPYQKTTTNRVQTGTETKLVDKKIVKGYVGGPDGKARLFFGNNGLIASFDGSYTSEMIDVDGASYELCTLTSSGILRLKSAANVWICGGGATGATTSPAGGCGGNIAQATLEDTSAYYYVNVGTADAATIITSSGETVLSASAGTTTSGGCGRGGYRGYSSNFAPVSNSVTDTHPYGIQTLDPTCAGGGSGATYQSSTYIYQAGNGGSSGIAATEATYVAKSFAVAAVGGTKGGGNGAAPASRLYSPNNGSNASYYGAGGGGCGVGYSGNTPMYKGKPGSGYQGVVFLFGKLDAKAHQHVKGTTYTITKQATCSATGIKTYKCTECGEDAFTETIPATGHMWSEYTDSDGVTWDKCIKCGLMVRPSS